MNGLQQQPVVDGVMFGRYGQVHRNTGLITECGTTLPKRRVNVTALQAQVHKLPLCTACYPFILKPKRVSR
jgi:hypothetical protein